MKAYKLFRKRKNGTLGSLFINKKQIIPLEEWLNAEEHETKGYKFRPGWHATKNMSAPHLSKINRVWCEVEIEDFEVIQRPQSQGGTWFIANRMKVIREVKN